MGACCCQNEIQRLPRLDFFNEFSDAMKSSENCHLFCHRHQIYCHTHAQTNQRDDIFTLATCCHEPKSTSLTTYASCVLLDNEEHELHTGMT